MIQQLSLYDAPEPLDDLRAQMERWPAETKVLVDYLIERGVRLEFHDDSTVERERLQRAAAAGMRWEWVDRFRGLRRSWIRDPRPGLEHLRWEHIGYEPRMERPLGVKAKDEGNRAARRSHWPRRLI